MEALSLQSHDETQSAAVALQLSNTIDRPVYRLAANLLLESLENLLDAGDHFQFEITLEQTQLFLLLTEGDFGNLANFCGEKIAADEPHFTVANLYMYLVFQLRNCVFWPLPSFTDILHWVPSIYRLPGECSIMWRLLEDGMFLASIDEAAMKLIGGQTQMPVPFVADLLDAISIERGADCVEILLVVAKAAVLERNNEDSPVLFSLVLSKLVKLNCQASRWFLPIAQIFSVLSHNPQDWEDDSPFNQYFELVCRSGLSLTPPTGLEGQMEKLPPFTQNVFKNAWLIDVLKSGDMEVRCHTAPTKSLRRLGQVLPGSFFLSLSTT